MICQKKHTLWVPHNPNIASGHKTIYFLILDFLPISACQPSVKVSKLLLLVIQLYHWLVGPLAFFLFLFITQIWAWKGGRRIDMISSVPIIFCVLKCIYDPVHLCINSFCIIALMHQCTNTPMQSCVLWYSSVLIL